MSFATFFVCVIIFSEISETFQDLIRLISEGIKKNLSERSKSMDNGASSYRRFLDGDDKGLAEIVRDYRDGLILYLHGIVDNISVAEELMEETFFKIVTKKPKFDRNIRSKPGFIPSGEMWRLIILGIPQSNRIHPLMFWRTIFRTNLI